MPKREIIKKDFLDRFYTKRDVSLDCIRYLRLIDYDKIIEPSAGDGSFSDQIVHENLVAMDIEPAKEYIKKQDWLKYTDNENNILVIGNPPFGNRNNMSKEFIKHAISIKGVRTIAFILPNVFLKHSNQKIFTNKWRLKKIVGLPRNSFLIQGKEYHVPCSFFVWDKSKGIDLRFDQERYKTCEDFEFCDKEKAHFFVMGAAPQNIMNPEVKKNTNRGYYIRATGISKDLLENRFKNTYWRGYSSVNGGAAWLTKEEIIKEYLEE